MFPTDSLLGFVRRMRLVCRNNQQIFHPRSTRVSASGFPQLGDSTLNAADGGDAGRKPGKAARKLPQISRRPGGLTLR